jgi:hypothetical protein
MHPDPPYPGNHQFVPQVVWFVVKIYSFKLHSFFPWQKNFVGISQS